MPYAPLQPKLCDLRPATALKAARKAAAPKKINTVDSFSGVDRVALFCRVVPQLPSEDRQATSSIPLGGMIRYAQVALSDFASGAGSSSTSGAGAGASSLFGAAGATSI